MYRSRNGQCNWPDAHPQSGAALRAGKSIAAAARTIRRRRRRRGRRVARRLASVALQIFYERANQLWNDPAQKKKTGDHLKCRPRRTDPKLKQEVADEIEDDQRQNDSNHPCLLPSPGTSPFGPRIGSQNISSIVRAQKLKSGLLDGCALRLLSALQRAKEIFVLQDKVLAAHSIIARPIDQFLEIPAAHLADRGLPAPRRPDRYRNRWALARSRSEEFGGVGLRRDTRSGSVRKTGRGLPNRFLPDRSPQPKRKRHPPLSSHRAPS